MKRGQGREGSLHFRGSEVCMVSSGRRGGRGIHL